MNFVSFDFETATNCRDSACALGLCVVERGVVQESRHWLIRPPSNEYCEYNTRVHGLGPADTAEAPEFDEVFSEVAAYIGNVPLVAHNASFDMSVLRSSLDARGQQYPKTDYYCTLVMSRAHWPQMPGHSLPLVLAQCGVAPHQHHDAVEDALAAAQVMLRIASDLGCSDVDQVAQALGIRAGRLDSDWYAPCGGSAPRRQTADRVKVGSIEVSTDASPDHPFYDADVAFTGTLLSMERAQAMQLVAERGGRPRTTVSRFTEYLVVGSVEYKSLLTGAPSRKMQWSCPVSVDTWKLGRCG